jgi:hypothetical protein
MKTEVGQKWLQMLALTLQYCLPADIFHFYLKGHYLLKSVNQFQHLMITKTNFVESMKQKLISGTATCWLLACRHQLPKIFNVPYGFVAGR